jgi:hypothetical protein
MNRESPEGCSGQGAGVHQTLVSVLDFHEIHGGTGVADTFV